MTEKKADPSSGQAGLLGLIGQLREEGASWRETARLLGCADHVSLVRKARGERGVSQVEDALADALRVALMPGRRRGLRALLEALAEARGKEDDL